MYKRQPFYKSELLFHAGPGAFLRRNFRLFHIKWENGGDVYKRQAYMSLMCYRYPEIRYHSDIMPEAMDMEIPNFILQPLLENSLMHGLKDRRYQGSVTLRICVNEQDNSELDIWLSDDGIGIPDDKMEELNAYNAKDSEACLLYTSV